MRHYMELPNGAKITSGPEEETAIQSLRLTECVNAGRSLTLGSTCSAMLEVTLLVTGELPPIAAGMEVRVFRGEGKKLGVFRLENPIRTGMMTVKLVGYDRVTALDRSAASWLGEEGVFPCTLRQFAQGVCQKCGVPLAEGDIPNGGLTVSGFTAKDATYRQVMEWIAEAAGCFCHATVDGELRLDSYRDTGKTLDSSKALRMQLQMGEVSPAGKVTKAAANSDILRDNPLLQGAEAAVMDTILQQLPQAYTPGKVVVPADADISVGERLTLTDTKGNRHGFLVMSKVTAGAWATLECTGDDRRGSTVKRQENAQGDGPMVLLGKTVHWQSNGDGTYALVGN